MAATGGAGAAVGGEEKRGAVQEKRPICGRGLDVVCIDGDILQATEFVMYIPKEEMSVCMKLLEESNSNMASTHDYPDATEGDQQQQYVLKVKVICNGEEVVNSLTGTSEDIAVVESSGRVAFFTADGGQSYFAPSEILTDMKLKSDCTNHIELKAPNMQFTSTCRVWLWSIHDNICVVDIDGTVTIEDVRGYVETVYMKMFTYIHDGIVSLLHKLNVMKLKLLFLTSRPVDHIAQTREFLANVMEEDVTIPESPLFMSQDFVLEALYREVIARNGAVIKAGILHSIRTTFEDAGRNSCPFIMGFGNKKSDGDAYSASGILPEFIFIINTFSELKGWEGDSKYQTYRDPELLRYIDENFRRPGMPCVFDSLPSSPTQQQQEASETDVVEHMHRKQDVDSNLSSSSSSSSSLSVVKIGDDTDEGKSSSVNNKRSNDGDDSRGDSSGSSNQLSKGIVVSRNKQSSSPDRKDKTAV